MPTIEKFRVNYFVGAMLAQGGNLWLEDSKIVFSPTSAIDRAMGAKDVEILFHQIRGITYTGALSRTFHIKTDDRVHKFEGAQAKKFWDLLEKALPDKTKISQVSPQPIPVTPVAKPVSDLACEHCHKPLHACYSFCPHCGARPKSACPSCHHLVDRTWAVCAFCGWKFNAMAA